MLQKKLLAPSQKGRLGIPPNHPSFSMRKKPGLLSYGLFYRQPRPIYNHIPYIPGVPHTLARNF